MCTTSNSIIFNDIIWICNLKKYEYNINIENVYNLFEITQKAAGVTSSLSKLELVRTKTAKLPLKTLPISTPSSKNTAPPLNRIKNSFFLSYKYIFLFT